MISVSTLSGSEKNFKNIHILDDKKENVQYYNQVVENKMFYLFHVVKRSIFLIVNTSLFSYFFSYFLLQTTYFIFIVKEYKTVVWNQIYPDSADLSQYLFKHYKIFAETL